ncbi:MAG: hypothetical protein WBA99_09040 [Nodosilinea sp.]
MPYRGATSWPNSGQFFGQTVECCFSWGYTDDAVIRRGVQVDKYDFLQTLFTPSTYTQRVRQVLDA